MKWCRVTCWRTSWPSSAPRTSYSARSIDERASEAHGVAHARARGNRSVGREVSARPQAVRGDFRAARGTAREPRVPHASPSWMPFAEYMGLPPNIQVYEIATFYSMFETKPVGRHHVSVCYQHFLSHAAWLAGSGRSMSKKKLGIKTGREHAGRPNLLEARRVSVWRRARDAHDDDGGPCISRESDAGIHRQSIGRVDMSVIDLIRNCSLLAAMRKADLTTT